MITIRFFNKLIRITSIDEELLHKHELAADIDWQEEAINALDIYRNFVFKYREDPLIKSNWVKLYGYPMDKAAASARNVYLGLKQQPWIDMKKMKVIDFRKTR